MLFWCRPAAILGLVIAVIVDSIYGVFGGWAWPHVGKKITKVIPAFTNGNSPTSIEFPAYMALVAAALMHRFPNSIFRRLSSAMFEKMITFPTAYADTATTSRSAVQKMVARNNSCISTIADTGPSRLPESGVLLSMSDEKVSETFARKLNESHCEAL